MTSTTSNAAAEAPRAPGPTTAILLAGWGQLMAGLPQDLVPLLGLPMLQRVIAHLSGTGHQLIHVCLGEHAAPIKAFLGDGTRWGCEINYHTPTATETLAEVCRRFQLDEGGVYTLANAAVLPEQAHRLSTTAFDDDIAGTALLWQSDESVQWTGWGAFKGAWLLWQHTPPTRADMEATLIADALIDKWLVPHATSVACPNQLLLSQAHLFDSAGTPDTCVIGRGSEVHPTATLIAPVHIGQGVQVRAHATVGPHVSVGDGALIDQSAHVTRSVILPETYVGEALSLADVIANGDQLLNARLNTTVRITDRHLLAPSQASKRHGQPGMGERALAYVLRGVLVPVQAWVGADRGVRCAHPLRRHFHDQFFPGLPDVIQGRSRLLGPPRRTMAEIDQLPPHWQALYNEFTPGLLTDAPLLGLTMGTSEAQFACDALACAQQHNRSAMLKLLGQYVRGLLTVSTPPAPRHPPIDTGDQAIARPVSKIYHHFEP